MNAFAQWVSRGSWVRSDVISRWGFAAMHRRLRRTARPARAERSRWAIEAFEPRVLFAALAVNDVQILEGNGGTTNVSYTVSLLQGGAQTVTVNFNVATSSATVGEDFQATSGTLTYTAGQTSKTVTVPVINDTQQEGTEAFFLNLANATNATLADSSGQGTIFDNDAAFFSISNSNVSEGNTGTTNATFTVTRSGSTAGTSTVNFNAATSSAAAGTDFQPTSGTLPFGPGVTTQTVNVPVIGDTLQEGNEVFFVNLGSPQNG